MKCKKGFIHTAWMVLIAALPACGPVARPGHPAADSTALRLAYVMSPGGPAHETAEYFAKLVKEKSKGKIIVSIFSSGQLGRERELIEGLNMGSVDMVLSGPSVIGWYAPQYGAVECPFIFRSYEHMDSIMKGPVGEDIERELLKVRNIRVLDYWHRGPRYLTTTNRKVTEPRDLEGLKLRVPELPIYIKAWKTLGATPTPLAYNEMFLALSQHVVDGEENPLEVIYTSSLYEVQKYLMDTEHLLSFYMLLISNNVFGKLNPEMQQVITQSALEAGKFGHNLMIHYEVFYKKKLIEKGMQFITTDREAFHNRAMNNVPPQFKNIWAPDLLKRMDGE